MNEQMMNMLVELVKTGGVEASRVLILYRLIGMAQSFMACLMTLIIVYTLAKTITNAIKWYAENDK